MSGYSAEIMQSRGIPDQGTHYLPKPVAPDTLLRKIRTMLDEETS